MAGLHVEKEKCVGCGLCFKTCNLSALTLKNQKAVVSDACSICGLCVSSCPFGALSIRGKEDNSAAAVSCENIWVLAEQHGGELARVSFELVGKARQLAAERGCESVSILAGKNAAKNAEKLIAAGADKVIICTDARLEENREEFYTEYAATLIKKHCPEIVLCGATKLGRSLAPRIAARIRTGLTADCTELEIDAETKLLRQTRPAFGGNLMATITCPNSRPQMATVRPGIMPDPAFDAERSGEIINETLATRITSKTELLKKIKSTGAASISDAETIIVAGKGIGNQKNLELVKHAAKLMGAELGCSRPLVDMGWCEYKHQVGQTGCTVAPKLLISVGVSGAVQHLAGISRAEKIIAINHDPEAPIFDLAHYSVIGDAAEILQALIETLQAPSG